MKHRVLNSGRAILVLMSFFILATVTAEALEKRGRGARNGVNKEQTVAANKERKPNLAPRQPDKVRDNLSSVQNKGKPLSGKQKGVPGKQSKIRTIGADRAARLNNSKAQVNRPAGITSNYNQRGQVSEPRRKFEYVPVVNNSYLLAARTDTDRKRARADRQSRPESRDTRTERRRDATNRDWRDDRRRYTRNYYRRPVVVHRHWVNWYVPLTYGGLRYYYNDGAYYRFNGFGFTLVSGNFGAYLYSLPYGYRTIVIDNYPYYYANNYYYIRDHARSVYLRVDDPYETVSLWKEEEAAPSYDTASSEYRELFIYPNAGQTEQEMDQDKYECHLWAVDQTGFDPSLGKPGDFDEYQRAQCACLEGRGYTVK